VCVRARRRIPDYNAENVKRARRPQKLRATIDRRGSGGVGDRMAEIFEKPVCNSTRRRKRAVDHLIVPDSTVPAADSTHGNGPGEASVE
jgi:hypothetical protein